jgi:hypothetical protein
MSESRNVEKGIPWAPLLLCLMRERRKFLEEDAIRI